MAGDHDAWSRLHEALERCADGDVLQTAADWLADRVLTPLVSVRLVSTGGLLVPACRTGMPLHRDPMREYRMGEGLVGWVAAEEMPLRLGRAEEDPRFLHRDDQERPIGSFLAAPIIVGDRCVGVLSAVHPAFDYFTDDREADIVRLAILVSERLEQAFSAGDLMPPSERGQVTGRFPIQRSLD